MAAVAMVPPQAVVDDARRWAHSAPFRSIFEDLVFSSMKNEREAPHLRRIRFKRRRTPTAQGSGPALSQRRGEWFIFPFRCNLVDEPRDEVRRRGR
ncbi:hypothetical protein ES332_A12G094900v1 [Gossypium tomentosum]|uniref:Uncharacterized protein n=1 Tax=Gossypium tomentosum TaxID=34277 RepID=A0A5D2MVB7_GOSTO|nr:hypothetical protein ES332_A12G094900v1 [Gossypium tomentosum]